MQNLFYLLLFFLFIIYVIIETLPVFLTIMGIGIIVWIVWAIIDNKKNKKQEILRAIQKEKNLKIQQIRKKCAHLTSSLNEETIMKEEKSLNEAKSSKPKTGYDKIFIDVSIKRHQLKHEIFKYAFSCIEAIKQNTFNEDKALVLDRLLLDYKEHEIAEDGIVISDFRKGAFRKLSETIADIRNKCFTMLALTPNISNLNLFNGSINGYKFDHNCFLNVKSSEEIIHLSCQKISYFIYPLFIVEANNKDDFTIHPWNVLSFNVRKIRAYTKGYGSVIKGAIEIGHTYDYTCIDGSPDRRYKNNDIYRTYDVYVLSCKQISGLNFIVANESLANRLLQCFNLYATLKDPKSNIEITKFDDADEFKGSSLLTVLDKTISEYGVEVVNSEKLFYIVS